MFIAPTVSGGGVAYTSVTARRVHVSDDMHLVVFLQDTTEYRRRNTLLFPPRETFPRVIHGDVLHRG